MKKILILLGIVSAFIVTTAFATNDGTNTLPGPGDGKTSCEVYGAEGYTATITTRVITPESTNLLKANVTLNKINETGKSIKIVAQLRNSSNVVIESITVEIEKNIRSTDFYFETEGVKGQAYYVTINSASCNI